MFSNFYGLDSHGETCGAIGTLRWKKLDRRTYLPSFNYGYQKCIFSWFSNWIHIPVPPDCFNVAVMYTLICVFSLIFVRFSGSLRSLHNCLIAQAKLWKHSPISLKRMCFFWCLFVGPHLITHFLKWRCLIKKSIQTKLACLKRKLVLHATWCFDQSINFACRVMFSHRHQESFYITCA